MDANKVDFSDVDGLWVPCNGSLTPWNTHLGSEEYEPDARQFELEEAMPADQRTDKTHTREFTKLYFGDDESRQSLSIRLHTRSDCGRKR